MFQSYPATNPVTGEHTVTTIDFREPRGGMMGCTCMVDGNYQLVRCEHCKSLGARLERAYEIAEQTAETVAWLQNRVKELEDICAESNEVCVCGCPADAHENYGEDGEGCGNDDHECVRTCVAVRDIVKELEATIQRKDVALRWIKTVNAGIALGRLDVKTLVGMIHELRGRARETLKATLNGGEMHDCKRVEKKVVTIEVWDAEHEVHGQKTWKPLEQAPEGYAYAWICCPCGAKHLREKKGTTV